MMSRFQSNRNTIEAGTLSYVVFDVIQYKGKSVANLPLMERKQLLDEIIPADTSLVAKVKYIEGHGPAYFDVVQQQGLEGSHSWLKVINYQYVDVLIAGLRKKGLWFASFAKWLQ